MGFYVTGATGFLGSQTINRLLTEGGQVRALVRRPEAVTELAARGVDVQLGDISDPNLVPDVAAGDTVIHCAAALQSTTSPDVSWQTNVEGTRRLLAAAEAAPAARFIHLSTTAVYGFAPSPVAEDAPKQPVGAYGKTKWAAEQLVITSHQEQALPVVILRPCTVLGRGDTGFWQRIAQLTSRRVIPLPGGGRSLFDLVYVSDVVEAIMAALTAPAAVGKAYNITDGEAHSYRDIVDIVVELTGRRPSIVSIPGGAMTVAQRAATRWLEQRGKNQQAERVKLLTMLNHDLHFAIDAARADLGYAPQVGLRAALQRVMAGSMAAGDSTDSVG
jgi:nucleoside-diphosphate-sugar epimerase